MMKYSRITGTGSYLPEKVLTNHDLEKIMDTSDEWIRDRTGIYKRRFQQVVRPPVIWQKLQQHAPWKRRGARRARLT